MYRFQKGSENNKADKKSFEREMQKGTGIAILYVYIWSSSMGGSMAITYKAWDGGGDLYDLL